MASTTHRHTQYVLTTNLRITGLLFVTENLLLLLENVQLGLVCFPLPHAGQRSEELLRLTVCGCGRLHSMESIAYWSCPAVLC